MPRVRFIMIILILSIGGAVFAFLYGKYEKYRISKFTVKFVYTPNATLKNPVFYIRSLNYKNQYLDYVNNYNDYINKKSNKHINFPIIYLPGGERIYIRKYLKDSLLVEFFDPDHHGKFFSFTTGYVAKSYVHDTLKKE